MHGFLIALNDEVDNAKGVLSRERQKAVTEEYRAIIAKAEVECPAPEQVLDKNNKPAKGKQKRSKTRNLLSARLC